MDGFVREYRQVYLYLLCSPPAVGYHFYVDVVILLSLILLYPDYLPCSYIPYIRSWGSGGVTRFAAISECCSESVISEQIEQRRSSTCSSFVKFAVGYERILIVNTYVYIILAHALRMARLQVIIALKYCREFATVAFTCADDHSTIILYVCASFLAAA